VNVFQRAVGWLAEASGAAERINDPMDPRLWGMTSALSTAGVTVTPDAAEQLGVVQSVLERLGGTVSSLPLMVFERTGPNGENRTPARNHPLFRLLHRRPNRSQTAQEFRDEAERHLAWWRNAYSIIREDDAGFPIGELEQVHPSRVLDVFLVAGRRVYRIRDLPPSTEVRTYSEDEIWHIRKAPLTKDGLRGRPVWETARETLGRALAVEQFGGRFFANSSHAGGIIEHPGRFKDKEEQADFLITWRAGGSGPNQHRDRLLLNGAKYTPPALTNEESQFLETKKEMKYELASLWNMPGHMVGLMDRATFSNIEQQSIEYVVHTLGPWIAAIEQAADRDLLVGPDQDRYFVEFNVSGLLRGDLKTRWAAYFQGRQGGWLSINDVRRLENMDPIGPAGDVYETALNMKPAGAPADRGPDDNPQDPADVQEDRDAP
jgi:HK97 family phage portal protein